MPNDDANRNTKDSSGDSRRFTPGPWRAYSIDVWMAHGDRIVVVSGVGPVGETLLTAQANAHLIAAAPDLFAALAEAVPAICDAVGCSSYVADIQRGVHQPLCADARAALAKALPHPSPDRKDQP